MGSQETMTQMKVVNDDDESWKIILLLTPFVLFMGNTQYALYSISIYD